MILQVDKQGEDIIQQLCHIALQHGGINNYNQVTLVFKSIQVVPEPEKPNETSAEEPQEKPESVIPAEEES